MAEAEAKSVLVAIKEYFGLTAAEAMAEIKKLTPEDKEYFKVELRKAGIAVRD